MHIRKFFWTLLWIGLIWPGWGLAHHGGGGGAVTGLQQSIGGRFNPPRTYAFYNFSTNVLNDGMGWLILNQVEGAYAFNSRFSVGGRIPIWTVRENFLPDNTRLGDVALLLKGQVWRSPQQRMSLDLGMDVTFPTGSDTESVGAGVVGLVPYLTFNKSFDRLQLFTTLSKTVELGAAQNPALSYEVGLQIPLVRGALPLNLLAALQGNTLFASDTFVNGSSQAFAVSGLLLSLSEHWEAALLGRLSMFNTLEFKSGISFDRFATGLLSDVLGGFTFNLGYVF